jgi:hypothetical protein
MPRRSLKLSRSRSRSRSLLGPWLSEPHLRSIRWSRAPKLGQVGGKSLRRQRAPSGGCPRPATNMARWRVRLGRRLERIEDRPPGSSRGGRSAITCTHWVTLLLRPGGERRGRKTRLHLRCLPNGPKVRTRCLGRRTKGRAQGRRRSTRYQSSIVPRPTLGLVRARSLELRQRGPKTLSF